MKSISNLKSEILNHYKDSFGYLDHCVRDIKKNQEPASGNGMLYTAEALLIFKRLENAFMPDFLNYLNALSKARVEPGLYHRHPLKPDSLDQHDNIIGRIVFKYMYGQCLDEWEYAQKHKKFGFLYSFNNLEPNNHSFGSCLLPHNAFVLNFCAGAWWGTLNTIAYAGMVLITPYKKHKDGQIDTGARLMGWMHIQPLVKRFKWAAWIERWYWKESNLTECARIYFAGTPWVELFEQLEGVIFEEQRKY